MNVTYIVRDQETGGIQDLIYGEDPTAKFSRTYTLEMYLKDVMGGGGGDFLSKFGLQVNESGTFVVSRRAFVKTVPSNIAIRPREGDLIYIPMQTNLYEIKFVESEVNFHTLGRDISLPYFYELKVELFKFSNENLTTGIPEIDSFESDVAYSIVLNLSLTGTGNYNIGELVYQGNTYNTATTTAKVVDWSPTNKTIKVVNIKGTISNTANIIGVTSNTSYAVQTYDDLANNSKYNQFDNSEVQTESNTFLIRTENDPWGVS